MLKNIFLYLIIFITMTTKSQYNKLSKEEQKIILHKGTEPPFTGAFNNFKNKGLFVCKQCESPLYFSEDKFDSGCGWPSFDDAIEKNVKRLPDSDGKRTEIICNQCKGHLGHVFLGEQFTAKNTRHCVNSLSLKFIPQENLKTAIFASGCFWGVQYHFAKIKGVLITKVGYTGGKTEKPTYQEICTGKTGHAEAIKVVYDTKKTDYESLCKLFFETHDPSQKNKQGPDIGTQYRSEIFYTSENQKQIAHKLIKILKEKGYKITTNLTKATAFWKAEPYHQNYYQKNGKMPYCHFYTKKF